jgi:hypothetical protein
MVIHLVGNAVFWLNAFPHKDGASSTLSPKYIMTGQHLNAEKHIHMEFGVYIQTHEEHSNDMQSQTIGAICLGPLGNKQGRHYFMSLTTRLHIHRNHWTDLPMPGDALDRVNALAR